MAEGRMIKKRISKSKKFAGLNSDSARLLYLMMYPHADIEGRLEADILLIKGQIIPLLNWKSRKIQACLNELVKVGLIALYNINGNDYLEFIRFKDFQILRTDREAKSEIPSPPAELQPNSSGTPALSISKDKLSLSKVEVNNTSQIKNLLELFPSHIQKDINTYLDRVRLKNKSKVITEGRKITILNELYNSYQRCNDENLFIYALEAAITHDAPNVGYINAVIKNQRTKKPL